MIKTLSIFSKIFIVSAVSISFVVTPVKANAVEGAAAGALASVASCYVSGAVGGLLSGAAAALDVPVNSKAANTITSANTAKNCTLDGIANGIKREILRSLVQDTLNWINNGFEGKPSYGADLGKIFQDTQSRILDDLIYNNTNLKGLCTDFELPLKFALQARFYGNSSSNNTTYQTYEPQCTLKTPDQITSGFENAYSWDEFLKVTTNPDNNAFGTYFNLVSTTEERINEANARINKEYEVNGGFLSQRRCSDEYIAARAKEGKSAKYDPADPRAGQGCPVTTPGRTVADQLNKVLGAEKDELVAADEFDEIIGAVINQLISKLLRDASGGGARGISESQYLENSLSLEAATLNTYKEDYLKSYNNDAYEIAVKVAESRLQTIENAQSQYTAAAQCWDTKNTILNNNLQLFSSSLSTTFGNDDSGPVYTELIKITTESARSSLAAALESFSSDIAQVNNDINQIRSNQAKALSIQDAVAGATSYFELQEIVSTAQILPAGIADQIALRDESNRVYDEWVNGEITGYDNRGNEIRKGGFVTSRDYCSQFTHQQDPSVPETDSYTPISTSQKSVGDINSLDVTGNITIIDVYDPYVDLAILENNLANASSGTGSSLTENNTSFESELSCIAENGIVSHGQSVDSFSYKNVSGTNCNIASNVTCNNGDFSYTTVGGTLVDKEWINSATCGEESSTSVGGGQYNSGECILADGTRFSQSFTSKEFFEKGNCDNSPWLYCAGNNIIRDDFGPPTILDSQNYYSSESKCNANT